MKVNIAGRHVQITTPMQDYARERAEKLDHFFVGIRHVDVTLDIDGSRQLVEFSAFLGKGSRLIAKGEAEDMYKAIDVAEQKLEKQVRRLHARLKGHRDRTRISEEAPPPSEAENEATYEQIVQEMLNEEED